ncbi:muscarinic acetylcholine receptor M1 [Chanos chanos]|uniref:Muscarinic acetylcholine receptor n=1 Tax=Chanos chanos TaxID=29144 RepID=A0A6J2UN69_CHACN|nr:muscarinic acetylcholine receptor M1-like [Chanos chanos]
MLNISTASLNLSNYCNGTAEPALDPVTWEGAMITLITVPLSLLTIIGNILVIISFRINPQLRTVSNYFLLSLAIADLILGTVSMNLYTTYILIGRWILGNLACDVWLAVDYVASNASVMNLLAISFDRYLSVTRPLTYRATRTPRRAAVMITLAWVVSLILWAPAILFWQYIVGERTVPEGQCFIQFLSEPVITFGTAIAAFYLPVTVMMVLYWRIYRKTEKRSQQLAGLIGSEGRNTSTTSQNSSRQQSHSGSSNTSSFGEAQIQINAEPKPKRYQSRDRRGKLCPVLARCATAWWNRRQGDTKTTSQTGSYNREDSRDENDKFPHIPLVRISSSQNCANDSQEEACPSLGMCQTDSQLFLDPTFSASGSRSAAGAQRASIVAAAASKSRKAKTSTLIREKKAARTLCAILLAFIITWTPYNIMVLVSTFCENCVPERLWQLGYWLCYVNSTANPVCYALCNTHFRDTFKALLLCRWREEMKRRRWAQPGGGW